MILVRCAHVLRRPLASIAGAVAFGMVLAGSVAPATAQAERTIKDWYGLCDNTLSCTAFGFAAEDGPGSAISLRLDRSGEGDAPARVSIGMLLNDPTKFSSGTKMRLAFDDPALSGLPLQPMAIEAGDAGVTAHLAASDVPAFLAAIRKAKALHVALDPAPAGDDGDGAPGDVSLDGAVGMMIWLDDQQHRGGTVTALVSTGAKPASVVPSPPAAPMIRAGAPWAGPQPKAGKVPAAIGAAIKGSECQPPVDGPGADPEVYRLSATTVLWGIDCGLGAHSSSSRYFLAEGAKVRPAMFPRPKIGSTNGDAMPGNELSNGGFDPKTRIMSAFGTFCAGVAGDAEQWLWDGKAFRLLEFRAMSLCKGVTMDQWPVVYRAKAG